jgi:hypothetical protein
MAQRVEKYPLVSPKARLFIILNQSARNSHSGPTAYMIKMKVRKKPIREKDPMTVARVDIMQQATPPEYLPTASPPLYKTYMISSNQLSD